ncbi:MAG: hypothetical protein WDN50_16910 [Bradyrhizobium sp.]
MNFQNGVQKVSTATRENDSVLPIDRPAICDDGFVRLCSAETTTPIVEVQAKIEGHEPACIIGRQELESAAKTARSDQGCRLDCIIHVVASLGRS